MKLIEKKNQHRRDFNGIYECEDCGNKEEHGGCYDDRYFHDEVTPSWRCEKCGESTKSLGVATKYADHEVV